MTGAPLFCRLLHFMLAINFQGEEDLWNTKRKAPLIKAMLFSGGDEGDRTLDLLNAIQTRSQLRYAPVWYGVIILYLSANCKSF